MTGYHDYVLGLIPAALLGITALLSTTGLSVQAAVPVGGGVAALLVAHAMFVRGPVTASPTPDAPDAAAQSGPAPNGD
ncbi:hypothetical protein [Candidatus Halobonum tyrrellensis]|uniref:Uncharacterized protein n=1 Tax=Candidatus Halobonum tyrrellensis G22 TaxID=1324957 RepID=V4HH74_9EURY|nr:hypothetical protein [Candidatus Halobonum tyrrellensis]ESP87219.1 hypothetical protein K933_15179 [Candidatus Halobonum tyrrellensis G22]